MVFLRLRPGSFLDLSLSSHLKTKIHFLAETRRLLSCFLNGLMMVDFLLASNQSSFLSSIAALARSTAGLACSGHVGIKLQTCLIVIESRCGLRRSRQRYLSCANGSCGNESQCKRRQHDQRTLRWISFGCNRARMA